MSLVGYIDSSVLLRFIFDEPSKLNINEFSELYSSDLIRTECMRACYRARLESKISDQSLSEYVGRTMEVLNSLFLIPISRLVVTKSMQPFPVHLRSLDSIHLATAMLLIERKSTKVPILTHDLRLAQAARSIGMSVLVQE